MILGLSSYTYGWAIGVSGNLPSRCMTEDDLIDKTIEHRLSCLQVGDNLPLLTLPADRLEKFRMRVRKEGLRLEIGARQLTEKRLEQYLQLADTFQSPLVRFVIDDAGYEPDASTVMGLLKNVVGYLGKKKIKLGIENHDRFKAKELAFIMEGVGDKNVGVCLDCANSLGAGEGIDYVSQVLASYTINLHIKDYKIERLSHKMGFLVQGCPAGKGMTDVPRLLEVLSAHGRCDSAILEQWVVPEADIDETVDKENRWAEEGIHYLKTIFENHI